MQLTIEGWDPVDRQPVRGCLHGLDRAQTQAADLVTVTLASAPHSPLTIKQNPALLQRRGSGAAVRVGAAVWDGAYVLSAFLDSQPPGAFAGARCVELGCGLGLCGLVLARLGAAAVWLTDKPGLVTAPRINAAKAKLLAAAAPVSTSCAAAPEQQQQQHAEQQQQQLQQQPAAASVVRVLGLDWEQPDSLQQAAAAIRAAGPVDIIVGSDCIYPDPDGSVPSSEGFMAAVCALATPGRTRVLTTFEARSDELRAALLAAAAGVRLPGGGRCEVQRLSLEGLPPGFQAQHVELYELLLTAGPDEAADEAAGSSEPASGPTQRAPDPGRL